MGDREVTNVVLACIDQHAPTRCPNELGTAIVLVFLRIYKRKN
jgi:hypothetical protein